MGSFLIFSNLVGWAGVAVRHAQGRIVQFPAFLLFSYAVFLEYPGKKGELYSILWMLVFGFATLNILALVAKHFEPEQTRLSFGEILAVAVVILALCLLGWEMLGLFKIFPIKLAPR
jgi:hypothetical protein